MTASPGHKEHPDHRVTEEELDARLQVFFNDEIVADSTHAIKVTEDGHPDRFYIPREDIKMEFLERTDETSECPFKGMAHYYTLKVNDREAENAVWTYEDPYDEHGDLKERLAFYQEKVDDLTIHPSHYAQVL